MHEYEAKVVRVIDGDSVWLEVDVGFRLSYRDNFRLLGIDTPELRSTDHSVKAKAYSAKHRLEEILPVGSQVRIETSKAGKYGRWLVYIYADGALVNDMMLAEGHAKRYGS